MNMRKMERRLKKITDFFELSFLQSLIEDRKQELLAARECQPKPQTVFSDRMLQRLFSEPITDIYKDCSMYFYGYEEGSYREVVLAKNLHAGGYPFENVSTEATMNGIYTRLEVVSNTDLFCYMSADTGNTINYPMCMSNTCAVVGSTTRIAKFSVGY